MVFDRGGETASGVAKQALSAFKAAGVREGVDQFRHAGGCGSGQAAGDALGEQSVL